MKPLRPVDPNIRRAANALLAGELVVLPTETVYGLAADAANPEAVEKIFTAKGRPANNPLIVHVSHMDEVELWSDHMPKGLVKLAKAFWPGPLTVIVPKGRRVSLVVTGGLDTVAIRIPSHSATLAVLERSGLCLAMPSANRFMGLSPTRASNIDPEIAKHCACIIDGGPSRVGIESTILDLTAAVPTILRPGSITAEEIDAVLGSVSVDSTSTGKAPGQYRRHYSPIKPTFLVPRLKPDQAGLTMEYAESAGQIQMPTDAESYAKKLYAALADMESRPEVSEIAIQTPPSGSAWVGVMDRLRKATSTDLDQTPD